MNQMRLALVFIIVLSVMGCAKDKAGPITVNEEVLSMNKIQVTSSAFSEGAQIPAKYTCDGAGTSPPLAFGNIPPGSKSLALIADDPDAPRGTYTHWLMWNIPVSHSIPEDSAPGIQGANSAGKSSYMGPCPPSRTHRYFFRVYALDTDLMLSPVSSRAQLESAMKGHVLAQGELMGTYARE